MFCREEGGERRKVGDREGQREVKRGEAKTSYIKQISSYSLVSSCFRSTKFQRQTMNSSLSPSQKCHVASSSFTSQCESPHSPSSSLSFSSRSISLSLYVSPFSTPTHAPPQETYELARHNALVDHMRGAYLIAESLALAIIRLLRLSRHLVRLMQ